MPECGYRRLEPSKITVVAQSRTVVLKSRLSGLYYGAPTVGDIAIPALSVVHLSESEPWAAPGKLRRGSPSILTWASPSLTANSLRLAGRAHALNVAAEFPGGIQTFSARLGSC